MNCKKIVCSKMCLGGYNLEYIHGVCADLGSSHGACSILAVKEAGDKVTKMDCYDMNSQALEIGRKLAGDHAVGHRMTYHQASLLDLPAKDETYDFIQTFHTLEHIYPEDTDTVLKEAYRVLRPGGYLLISIPYDHAYSDPCHVAFYKEDNLQELFNRNGFQTIYCYEDNRWNEKTLLTALFKK